MCFTSETVATNNIYSTATYWSFCEHNLPISDFEKLGVFFKSTNVQNVIHVGAKVVLFKSGYFPVSQSLEPSHQILSENIALAIILPIILVILLIGGIYMYYSK